MLVGEAGFESLSITAEVKYKVDEKEVISKTGKYSTAINGSDSITNKRYYSFDLTSIDVENLKKGNAVTIAGQFSPKVSWSTKELNLRGFTVNYEKMCN